MATDSVKIQEKAADVLRIMKEEVASVAGPVRKSLNAMRSRIASNFWNIHGKRVALWLSVDALLILTNEKK